MSKFVRGQYLNTELRKENDRIRAALQKAEARIEPLLGQIACLEGLSIVYQKQREKAEAERSAMRARLAPSVEYVDGLACGYGEDEIDRLDARLDSERARADRYLAAMRDAVRAYDRLAKGGYGGDLAVAWATLRSIVEEARRG